MSFFSPNSDNINLFLFRLKEVILTIIYFLIVTMSLYHVFFDRYAENFLDHKKKYRPIIDNRNNEAINILTNFKNYVNDKYEGDSISILSNKLLIDFKNNFQFHQDKLDDYHKKKNKIMKEHHFRGRSSFRFWLYVFGIVSALFFFSIKSLYNDIINKNSYRFQFISITGICIAIFWSMHLIFFTKTDISKNGYILWIILSTFLFGIFGYYSIKNIAKAKFEKKK